MAQNFGVAVKGIIKNTEGKYLILYKSNLDEVNPHDFDIPGGRIHRGESLEDALQREVQEETALTIKIEKLSRSRGFTTGDTHLVGITYLASCRAYQNIHLSGEHNEYWRKTKEEILTGDFPARLKEEFKAI